MVYRNVAMNILCKLFCLLFFLIGSINLFFFDAFLYKKVDNAYTL